MIIKREKTMVDKVPGEMWYSLRLDGTGFSKAVKALRNTGIIEKNGFSAKFADCMKHSCHSLVEKFGGKIGYT